MERTSRGLTEINPPFQSFSRLKTRHCPFSPPPDLVGESRKRADIGNEAEPSPTSLSSCNKRTRTSNARSDNECQEHQIHLLRPRPYHESLIDRYKQISVEIEEGLNGALRKERELETANSALNTLKAEKQGYITKISKLEAQNVDLKTKINKITSTDECQLKRCIQRSTQLNEQNNNLRKLYEANAKRYLEENTKLIEEKGKLQAEKTEMGKEMLAMRSELERMRRKCLVSTFQPSD
ncbi:hypothetical protein CI109_100155 [Kwoniella shandongensis]|uniref:Uncharacterized protein n=1 Tax=Kwoniella shandongensis TaxID=1734106 RepID=A0AAJ8LB40_9TREE